MAGSFNIESAGTSSHLLRVSAGTCTEFGNTVRSAGTALQREQANTPGE